MGAQTHTHIQQTKKKQKKRLRNPPNIAKMITQRDARKLWETSDKILKDVIPQQLKLRYESQKTSNEWNYNVGVRTFNLKLCVCEYTIVLCTKDRAKKKNRNAFFFVSFLFIFFFFFSLVVSF